MKVIAVHGIRRTNKWYEDIEAMEIVNQERLKILPYDYGFFDIWKFVQKGKRNQIVDEFAQFYNDNIKPDELPPSVIAHSFGTAVVLEAMKKHNVIKFDNIIFCGSILNSKTDFRPYITNGQVSKLINDHGSQEWFVFVTRYLSKMYGKAGKTGFKDIPAIHKNKIINRNAFKGHSDYFLPLSMQKNWIEPLVQSRKIKDFDVRILRREVIDRIYDKSFQGDTIFEVNDISFHARIDLDGNYFAKYHAKGINNSVSIIDKYSFSTSADGMHDITKMKFRIYDEENNLLECDGEEDFSHKKVVKIRLQKPIQPKGLVDQRIYFCWYNTINLDSGDTDHWNIQGIRNITVQLNFPNSLKSPKFFGVKDYEIIERINPQQNLEIDNSHTYSLTFTNSNNLDGLIFYFEGKSNTKNRHKSYRPFKPIQIREGRKKVYHCEPAKLEDISKIYQIETEVEHSNAATEETLRQRLNMFNDGFLVIKNRRKKKILGYIESIIWNDKDFQTFDEISNFPIHYNIRGTSLYIIFIATSKEHRKKGIAKKLMEEIEKQAKGFGIRTITLVAKDDLVTYYSKFGFNQVKELPDFLPSRDYKSIKMKKEI
jgi:ribosomal protein S18 acetylase RimI-like enzyme